MQRVVVVADRAQVSTVRSEARCDHRVDLVVVVDDRGQVLPIERGAQAVVAERPSEEPQCVIGRAKRRPADHPEVFDVAVLAQGPAVVGVAAQHLRIERLGALASGPVETPGDAPMQVGEDDDAFAVGTAHDDVGAGARRPATRDARHGGRKLADVSLGSPVVGVRDEQGERNPQRCADCEDEEFEQCPQCGECADSRRLVVGAPSVDGLGPPQDRFDTFVEGFSGQRHGLSVALADVAHRNRRLLWHTVERPARRSRSVP